MTDQEREQRVKDAIESVEKDRPVHVLCTQVRQHRRWKESAETLAREVERLQESVCQHCHERIDTAPDASTQEVHDD